MTELVKLIKNAVKENKTIIGYKQVLKEIKTGKLELVVYANNLPKDKIKEIEHNSKIGNIKVQKFSKDNVELGLICSLPFKVSIMGIKSEK